MKIALAIGMLVVLLGAVFFLANRSPATTAANVHNVRMEGGKQVVEIDVDKNYNPKTSVAKLGIPTILRFKTNGSIHCTSDVRIPSMNIKKFLPLSGITDIDLGSPQVATLQGVCGMGM